MLDLFATQRPDSRIIDWRSCTLRPLYFAFSFFLLLFAIDYFHLAYDWTSLLYQWEGSDWVLRNNFWFEQIFHNDIRWVNYLAVVVVILSVFNAAIFAKSRWLLRDRLLLFVSLLFCFGLVAYLKQITNMDCPWDIVDFGGNRDYYGIFSIKPESAPMGHCYPAGHASIGYAWISLYFYWHRRRPQAAKVGLAIALIAGIVLGIVQQLRGAHFFTDDITTAFVCTVISWGIFKLGRNQGVRS
ncbi:PAP2 family protein [Idiomarina tyrosinivorans]|uniref:PAP2 family protein n=1 Tax=Idiomarina tyrosinivorans TaxID=1445662 RepID=A0A432ZPU3_9GAMM|nr:phosphatase PAP2 family protein [Idiomarina tyrosinivorans]RUO79903.1 PAP2 family protein [Idiomarina tyrosinivorans]